MGGLPVALPDKACLRTDETPAIFESMSRRRTREPHVTLQGNLFEPELVATGGRVQVEIKEGIRGYARLVIDGDVYREPLNGRPAARAVAICLERYLATR